MMPMRDSHARADIDQLARRFEAMMRDFSWVRHELNVINDRVTQLGHDVEGIKARLDEVQR